MSLTPKILHSTVGTTVVHAMSRLNTTLSQVSRGRLGSKIPNPGGTDLPVALVTTTGRQTGRPRTVPLLYLPDGDDVILVASQYGSPSHPAWYLNLTANPMVTFQIPDSPTRALSARTATDAERERLWPKLVELYSAFDTYQSWTDRKIPVVICSPV